MNRTRHTAVTERSAAQRIAILSFAVLQVLATMLPSIGFGEAIGERSDAVDTIITPAGWAFSIWGPLFAGSIAYGIYQILPAQKHSVMLARIGWPSAGAFLGNAVWALYTQSFGLAFVSALIIAFTLLCLLVVYRRFAAHTRGFSIGEQAFVVLPLSALTAWLTAATIVNVAAVLEYHGLDAGGASPLLGAAIVLIGGLIASAAIWNGRGNPWYALVFLWALAGIYSASAGESGTVAAAAIVSGLIVAASTVARLLRSRDRHHWFAGAEGMQR